MIARSVSAVVRGIDAFIVDVEVDVSRGLPAFDMVGLPDAGARESKERVRAAIRNSGWEFPAARITVNLAPARWRKVGPGFDLPVALAILQAAGHIPPSPKPLVVVGELALDGSLRPVAGGFCIADAARRAGIRRVLMPRDGTMEAAIVPEVQVLPAATLREAVQLWKDPESSRMTVSMSTGSGEGSGPGSACDAPDLASIRGQFLAKRALEIAAAGGHNLLMVGPPGAGKTMLARCLPGILPDLGDEEAIEVTRIYSAAGKLRAGEGLVRRPPWRAPHHSMTLGGLIGGGADMRPGEVTLAHRGVLFLDELPEFGTRVLEALRQPLEDGCVTLSRYPESWTYPARFQLVAAANPCPCGYLGDSEEECRCRERQLARYAARLSGPLADRIDLHVRVDRLPERELLSLPSGEAGREDSATVRKRVERARQIQRERSGSRLNGFLDSRELRVYCRLDRDGKAALRTGLLRLKLSARGVERVLRVSRTLADLDGRDSIGAEHVLEALQYRQPVWPGRNPGTGR